MELQLIMREFNRNSTPTFIPRKVPDPTLHQLPLFLTTVPPKIINGEITRSSNPSSRENEAVDGGTLFLANSATAEPKIQLSCDAKAPTKESITAEHDNSSKPSSVNNELTSKEENNDDAVMEDGSSSNPSSSFDGNLVNEPNAAALTSSASNFLSNWKPKHRPLQVESTKSRSSKKCLSISHFCSQLAPTPTDDIDQ